MSGSIQPCGSLAQPHGTRYARRYLTGWRCNLHTPAAEAGKPEPPPGPGWPPGAYIFQPAPTPTPNSGEETPS